MKKKRQDHFHDIYRAPNRAERGEDYNWKVPLELQAHIRRQYFTFVFYTLLFIGLAVGLVTLLTRDLHPPAPQILSTASLQSRSRVPYYTLPMDEDWVLTYEASVRNAEPENDTDHAVSSKWVKNAAYHVIMGHQALRLELYEESAAHFEKVLQVFPAIRHVYEPLGIAYLKQRKFDEAIAALHAGIEESETLSAINNLGAALMEGGRFVEAETYLLQSLTRQPEQAGCYKNLFLLYQKMGNPEKTIYYFEKYITLCPTDFVTAKRYAEYLVEQDQTKKATAFLREACQQEGADALPFYLLLANVEARATNDVQAVDALRNIARYISPNLVLAQLYMEEFDTIRNTEAFQDLLHQMELAEVTLENQN